MFEVTIDKSKNTFSVYGKGLFSADECKNLINDFRSKAKTFTSKDFALIVDGRDISTNTPDVAPFLEEMSKMYLETQFKERYFVVPKSTLANMQIKRLAKDDFYSKVTLVTSVEEAIQKFGK